MLDKETRTRLNIILLLLIVCPIAIRAQNCEVGGTVLGPSGSVIAKASVEFRNRHTGTRWQAITKNDGEYHIDKMDPGHYDATVEAGGFKTLSRENMAIQAGSNSKIDFMMKVGVASRICGGDRNSVNPTAVRTIVGRQPISNTPFNEIYAISTYNLLNKRFVSVQQCALRPIPLEQCWEI